MISLCVTVGVGVVTVLVGGVTVAMVFQGRRVGVWISPAVSATCPVKSQSQASDESSRQRSFTHTHYQT